MNSLLPPLGILEPAITRPERAVHLFVLARARGDVDPGGALVDALSSLGASVQWSATTDSVVIGQGELRWTHAVWIRLPSGQALVDAVRQGETFEVDLEDLRVDLFEPVALPAALRVGFRLLRPLGWVFERIGGRHEAPQGAMDERAINPTREQLAAVAADTRPGPAFMINFLTYRERAEYDGAQHDSSQNGSAQDESDVSGRTAYERYARVAMRCVAMLGGRPEFLGGVRHTLVESDDPVTVGPWHTLAIVRYPAPRKLAGLKSMPGYLDALAHRNAGLERTALILSRGGF